MTSVAALKQRTTVSIDGKFSLRAYINSAAKLRDAAEKADRDGDQAAAYVGYKKMGNLVRAMLDHPEFKALQASKASEYYTFMDLKARVITATHRAKELEPQLQARENEQAGRSTPGSPPAASGVPASVESISTLTVDGAGAPITSPHHTPHDASFGTTGVKTAINGFTKQVPPPVPSASSKPAFPAGNGQQASPTSPTGAHRPARISGNLAARMAALYNAGMEGAGDHSSGSPTSMSGRPDQPGTQPLSPSGSDLYLDTTVSRHSQLGAPSAVPPMPGLKRTPAIHVPKSPSAPFRNLPQPDTLDNHPPTPPIPLQHSGHVGSEERASSPPHVSDPNTDIERPDSAPPALPHGVAPASGPATSGIDMLTDNKTGSSSRSQRIVESSSNGFVRHGYNRSSSTEATAGGDGVQHRLAALASPMDLDDFSNRFPDVDSEGFNILPKAPTSGPSDNTHFEKGGIPQPFHPAPQSSSSPVSRISALPNGKSLPGERRGSLSSVPTDNTGGSGKANALNGFSQTQLQQAAASKPTPPAPGAKPGRGPLPQPPSTPSLPNLSSNSITPNELWAYLDRPASSTPSVLLIDVRTRKDYASGHIKGKSVLVEYFTLSSNSTAGSIENGLVVSPDEERENFSRRAQFDLIVIYDKNTRALPPRRGQMNGASGVVGFRNTPATSSGNAALPLSLSNGSDTATISSEAKTLGILVSAIYEFNFADEKNRLKRSPLLLVGGYEAWVKEIGDKGVERSPISPSAAIGLQSRLGGFASKDNEYQAMLANRGILQPTPASSASNATDIKRQHRKAVISGDGAIGSANSIPYQRDDSPLFGNPMSPPQSVCSPYAQPAITVPPVAVHRTGPSSPYEAYPSTPHRGPMYGSGTSRHVGGEYFDQYTSPQVSKYGMTTQPMPSIPYQPSRPIDYPNLQQRGHLPNGSPGRPQPLPSSAQNVHTPAGKVQVPPPVLARAPSSSVLDNSGASSFQLLQSASYLTNPAFGAFPKQLTALGDGSVGLTGLKNLGNTCYMNSMVQCLSATIPLARFLKEGSYKKAINKQNPLGTKGVLADAVAQLVQSLWAEHYSFLAPVTFRDAICRFQPRFKGSDQHDSQEFLSFMLDGLHEDLNLVVNKPKPVEYTPEREAELESLPTQIAAAREWNIYLRRDDSIIVRLMQGQYKNQLKCLTCGATSTTYNTFMYLSLPVPSGKSIGKVSLGQCLDLLTRPETMEGGDAWNCPKCKKPRSATKTLTIARLPPILLIHLKRFSFQGPFTDKIDTQVIFPTRGMDMTAFLPPLLDPAVEARYTSASGTALEKASNIYDLHAVSNHFGSLSSGHYTAYVRSRGQWNDVNDSKITRIPEAQVAAATKSCYTLWFTRRG